MTVRVRNTGARAGDEVVQLYLHDVVAQVTRPVQQLIGFARVRLEPGEAADVRFQRARRPDGVHRPRTCSGSSSPASSTCWSAPRPPTGLPARLRLTGPLRVVGSDRRMITPVEVSPRTV